MFPLNQRLTNVVHHCNRIKRGEKNIRTKQAMIKVLDKLQHLFLPGESQGQGSLLGCHLWRRTESDMTEATQQQQQQHLFMV